MLEARPGVQRCQRLAGHVLHVRHQPPAHGLFLSAFARFELVRQVDGQHRAVGAAGLQVVGHGRDGRGIEVGARERLVAHRAVQPGHGGDRGALRRQPLDLRLGPCAVVPVVALVAQRLHLQVVRVQVAAGGEHQGTRALQFDVARQADREFVVAVQAQHAFHRQDVVARFQQRDVGAAQVAPGQAKAADVGARAHPGLLVGLHVEPDDGAPRCIDAAGLEVVGQRQHLGVVDAAQVCGVDEGGRGRADQVVEHVLHVHLTDRRARAGRHVARGHHRGRGIGHEQRRVEADVVLRHQPHVVGGARQHVQRPVDGDAAVQSGRREPRRIAVAAEAHQRVGVEAVEQQVAEDERRAVHEGDVAAGRHQPQRAAIGVAAHVGAVVQHLAVVAQAFAVRHQQRIDHGLQAQVARRAQAQRGIAQREHRGHGVVRLREAAGTVVAGQHDRVADRRLAGTDVAGAARHVVLAAADRTAGLHRHGTAIAHFHGHRLAGGTAAAHAHVGRQGDQQVAQVAARVHGDVAAAQRAHALLEARVVDPPARLLRRVDDGAVGAVRMHGVLAVGVLAEEALGVERALAVEPFGEMLARGHGLDAAQCTDDEVAAFHAVARVAVGGGEVAPHRRVLAPGGVDHRFLVRQAKVAARAHLEIARAGAHELACAVVGRRVVVRRDGGVGRAHGDRALARGLRDEGPQRHGIGRGQLPARHQPQVPRRARLQQAAAVRRIEAVAQVAVDGQVAARAQGQRAFARIREIAVQVPVAVQRKIARAADLDARHDVQGRAQPCGHRARCTAKTRGMRDGVGLDRIDRGTVVVLHVVGADALEHRRARAGDGGAQCGHREVVMRRVLLRAQAHLAAFVAGHVDQATHEVQLPAGRFERDAAVAEAAGRTGEQLRAGLHRHAVAGRDADGAAVGRARIHRAGDVDAAPVRREAEVFHLREAAQRHVALADAELARPVEARVVQPLAEAGEVGQRLDVERETAGLATGAAGLRSDQAVEHHRAALRCRQAQRAGVAAVRVRGQMKPAAGVQPHVAARRRQGDAPRIRVLGHVEELLGRAAHVDQRALRHDQAAAGGRHVDAAAPRDRPAAEGDAAAGEAQPQAQAFLQVERCGRAFRRCHDLQGAARGNGLRRAAASGEQRRAQRERRGAGVDAARAFADDGIAAGQRHGAEARERLLARAQHERGGVEGEATHTCAGRHVRAAAAVDERDALALDDHIARASPDERGAIEGQRLEAGRAQVERAVEVEAGVAAQRQPCRVGQLRERAAVQHHAFGAAAEADAAGRHRQVGAGDLRRGGQLRRARRVDEQGRAAVDDGTGTDRDQPAARGVHALANDLGCIARGHADQRAPVFGGRGQHIVHGVLGVDHAVGVVVQVAVRVGVDRRHSRLHDQVARAPAAGAPCADAACALDGDLVAGRQDDFGTEEFGAFVVAHDDVGRGHVQLQAECIALALAAHQQAAGAEVRQARRIDDEVAVGLQAGGVLPAADDGNFLAGNVDQPAAPACIGCRAQRAVQHQASLRVEHDRAAVARQAGRDDVLASETVLRELEGFGRKEVVGRGLVVFGIAAQRAAGHHAPGRGPRVLPAAMGIAGPALHDQAAVRRAGGRRPCAAPCLARGLHREGAGQQRKARGQQLVPAGRQPGAAGEPDALPRRASARAGSHRCRTGLAGQDRVHARHGQHVVRAARARHEFGGMQVAAARDVHHRAACQCHVGRLHGDALLGRRNQGAARRIGDVDALGRVVPMFVVGQRAEGHGDPGARHRREAARAQRQAFARIQFDLAEGRAQHAVLRDHRRLQAQAAAGRQRRAVGIAFALDGDRIARADHAGHRGRRVDLAGPQHEVAVDVQVDLQLRFFGDLRGQRAPHADLAGFEHRASEAADAHGTGLELALVLRGRDVDQRTGQGELARCRGGCCRRSPRRLGHGRQHDVRRAQRRRRGRVPDDRPLQRDRATEREVRVVQPDRALRCIHQREVGKAAVPERLRTHRQRELAAGLVEQVAQQLAARKEDVAEVVQRLRGQSELRRIERAGGAGQWQPVGHHQFLGVRQRRGQRRRQHHRAGDVVAPFAKAGRPVEVQALLPVAARAVHAEAVAIGVGQCARELLQRRAVQAGRRGHVQADAPADAAGSAGRAPHRAFDQARARDLDQAAVAVQLDRLRGPGHAGARGAGIGDIVDRAGGARDVDECVFLEPQFARLDRHRAAVAHLAHAAAGAVDVDQRHAARQQFAAGFEGDRAAVQADAPGRRVESARHREHAQVAAGAERQAAAGVGAHRGAARHPDRTVFRAEPQRCGVSRRTLFGSQHAQRRHVGQVAPAGQIAPGEAAQVNAGGLLRHRCVLGQRDALAFAAHRDRDLAEAALSEERGGQHDSSSCCCCIR
ncbi:hypothetical protein D3C86_718300 [compost metagenome]